MNLSLVVLAAGASRRFGAANKLLQLLDGKPLLCHTLELAAALPVMQRTAVCSVETAPLAEAGRLYRAAEPAAGAGTEPQSAAGAGRLPGERRLPIPHRGPAFP